MPSCMLGQSTACLESALHVCVPPCMLGRRTAFVIAAMRVDGALFV